MKNMFNMNDCPNSDKYTLWKVYKYTQNISQSELRQLSVFIAPEISGQWVMLDGLVKHQGQESCSVGHGCPHIAFLFEQLVQLVPLFRGKQVCQFIFILT